MQCLHLERSHIGDNDGGVVKFSLTAQLLTKQWGAAFEGRLYPAGSPTANVLHTRHRAEAHASAREQRLATGGGGGGGGGGADADEDADADEKRRRPRCARAAASGRRSTTAVLRASCIFFVWGEGARGWPRGVSSILDGG
jgi:hypothetical protein